MHAGTSTKGHVSLRSVRTAHLHDLGDRRAPLRLRLEQPVQQRDAARAEREVVRDVELARLHLLEHREDALRSPVVVRSGPVLGL